MLQLRKDPLPSVSCMAKKYPFASQKPKLRPRLMVHPFFVNMLDKFEALMRKVSWHFYGATACHGREKTTVAISLSLTKGTLL